LWSRQLPRALTIASGARRLTRSPSTCERKTTSSSQWMSSAQRRRIDGRTWAACSTSKRPIAACCWSTPRTIGPTWYRRTSGGSSRMRWR
jgi:hypothetical protein